VKVSFYLDEDSMARFLVAALRARGTDVQTVVEAGLRGKGDEIQLQWAASKKRVVYTSNASDFCRLRQRNTSAPPYDQKLLKSSIVKLLERNGAVHWVC